MTKYRVMLCEDRTDVEAESEAEAKETALKIFKEKLQADDLIAWEQEDK